LSEAESRSVLDERALVCGRHIFGWYFPFRVAQLKRDDIWPNRKGDSRIGGFLIQPAGWEEAGMDGKTLFYGPA
jgi:hypothetical protein